MNLALVLGGIGLAVALVLGGVKAGMAIEKSAYLERDLAEAAKVVVKIQTVVKVEQKIVPKLVKEVQVIENEVTNVIHVIPKHLDPDCRMPDGFGLLLVAAANGLNPEDGPSVAHLAGPYDCRQVLAATIKDLEAGWKNSARYSALRQRTLEVEAIP